MNFLDCLPIILKSEGGFTIDTGGPTMRGITEEVYHKYLFRKGQEPKSVRKISDGEVADIYNAQYWLEGGCDKIPDIVRLSHFDYCVNAGIDRAKETLQRIAGSTRDGIIGPKTVSLLNKMTSIELLNKYTNARLEFYTGLAERKPKVYQRYLNSWISRTNLCKRLSLEDYGKRVDDLRSSQVPQPSNTDSTPESTRQ